MSKPGTRKIVLTTILIGFGAPYMQSTHADENPSEEVRVGRYSYIAPIATAEQSNPLNVVISLKLPQQIENVGTAIEFLLQRSGYRLEKNVNKEATAMLYDLDIPAVHRDLGPITLENALQTLTGPEWDLKINKLTRKITFFARDYRSRPEPYPGSSNQDDRGGDVPANSNLTIPPVSALTLDVRARIEASRRGTRNNY